MLAVRLFHITLAILILFSSTGLLINQHYCRNELKHSALFARAKSCHARPAAGCPMHAPAQEEPKGCCNDESYFLKHKQDQVQAEAAPVKAPAAGVALFIPAFNTAPPAPNRQNIHYLNYKPPLIFRDFPASLQVFRL
ncbi:MAG: hypothetical protein KDD10_29090 [Phaeodactylibacter sp.]|nr:hypothetical protein [Phaeodactylibacter sp.]